MNSISVSLVKKNKNHVLFALEKALGSRDSALIVYQGIRLQSQYGSCFASASFLGHDVAVSRFIKRNGYGPEPGTRDMEKVRHNAKILTVRLFDQLRRAGLITTERRVRPNGYKGTNLIDFSILWHLIVPAVKKLVATKFWNQAKRVWTRLGESLLLIRSSGDLAGYYEEQAFRVPPLPPLVNRGVKEINQIQRDGG